MAYYGTQAQQPAAGTMCNVNLQKADMNHPWGFRLQGGKDFRMPLSIKKVSPGTPAHGRVEAGDAICAIGGYDTSEMTHIQAQQMIKNSGTSLQITVKKGMFRTIRPTGPVKFSPATAYGYR